MKNYEIQYVFDSDSLRNVPGSNPLDAAARFIADNPQFKNLIVDSDSIQIADVVVAYPDLAVLLGISPEGEEQSQKEQAGGDSEAERIKDEMLAFTPEHEEHFRKSLARTMRRETVIMWVFFLVFSYLIFMPLRLYLGGINAFGALLVLWAGLFIWWRFAPVDVDEDDDDEDDDDDDWDDDDDDWDDEEEGE